MLPILNLFILNKSCIIKLSTLEKTPEESKTRRFTLAETAVTAVLLSTTRSFACVCQARVQYVRYLLSRSTFMQYFHSIKNVYLKVT